MATVKDVDGEREKIKGQCHSQSECICCYGTLWAHALKKEHCDYCEKTQIRQFDEQKERVETGAIRFGEDWPGVFIRGDNAYAYRVALQGIFNKLKEDKSTSISHHLELVNIRSLIELLDSCNLNDRAALERDWDKNAKTK